MLLLLSAMGCCKVWYAGTLNTVRLGYAAWQNVCSRGSPEVWTLCLNYKSSFDVENSAEVTMRRKKREVVNNLQD